MTTLYDYLDALNTLEAQNQFVKTEEAIQRGADPLRKGNEALGLYTEKKTFKVNSLPESDIPEVPATDMNLDTIRSLLAQGWVVKDMSFRLEKPNG